MKLLYLLGVSWVVISRVTSRVPLDGSMGFRV